MKKILLIGIICLVSTYNTTIAQLSIKSYPQSLEEADPKAVGMSEEKLQRIDQMIQQHVNDKNIQGAVAMITRRGKIVYQKSFGTNGASDMKEDDLFRIASMTKPITSIALMMLYEEGKFLLDEPLYKYIPEFQNPVVIDSFNESDSTFTTVPSKKEITIRQLLTHTSGITYGFMDPKKYGAIYYKSQIPDITTMEATTIGEKVKRLAKMPLVHEPGLKFTYGLSTDVCGYLVEVLSGMSLSDFLEKRILLPLGMKDTHFFYNEDEETRLVKMYFTNKEGIAEKYTDQPQAKMTEFPVKGAKTYYSGGGGLCSTASDYLKFCQMLLNGGEFNNVRLVSRKTIELMTSNQLGEQTIGFSKAKFGLGFSIATPETVVKNIGSLNRFSWGGAFSTTFWIDTQESISAVLMLQMIPYDNREIFEKFEIGVYQAIVD